MLGFWGFSACGVRAEEMRGSGLFFGICLGIQGWRFKARGSGFRSRVWIKTKGRPH